MLTITPSLSIPEKEIDLIPIRASGPGGQHINKVASAIHLRFNIDASSLPDTIKERLRALPDRRISEDGIIVIKSQTFRTVGKNRDAALKRLQTLILSALRVPKKRKPTKPSSAARKRRIEKKKKLSQRKSMRKKINSFE